MIGDDHGPEVDGGPTHYGNFFADGCDPQVSGSVRVAAVERMLQVRTR